MNSSTPPTLMFLTDAIRGDHINPDDSPFIHDLMQSCSHARRLRPNFGFCERVEFFTGTRPDQNGYLCALTLGEGSEFSRWDTALWRAIDWESLPLRRQRRRLMRGWFHRLRGIRQPIYEIPMRLLPRVTLTEDRWDFFEDLGRHSVETIFDVMAREKRSVFGESFISLRRPLMDDDSMTRILSGLDKHHDLYLMYQGKGDTIGHLHGPHTPQCRATLREVDGRVERVVTAFRQRWPEGRFVIFGDHGMIAVERHLSLTERVRRVASGAGLRLGRDFELWLDSTLMRLWLWSDRAREVFTRWAMENEELNEHGEVLTADRCEDLHVPRPGGAYGDLLWLAKPGTLIWPDYFHRDHACRGMHGYETNVDGQKSYAVWHHPERQRREVDEIHGTDICALLCDLVGVSLPAQCIGVSPL